MERPILFESVACQSDSLTKRLITSEMLESAYHLRGRIPDLRDISPLF